MANSQLTQIGLLQTIHAATHLMVPRKSKGFLWYMSISSNSILNYNNILTCDLSELFIVFSSRTHPKNMFTEAHHFCISAHLINYGLRKYFKKIHIPTSAISQHLPHLLNAHNSNQQRGNLHVLSNLCKFRHIYNLCNFMQFQHFLPLCQCDIGRCE